MSVLCVRFKLIFAQKQLWLLGSLLGMVVACLIVTVSFSSYYRQRFYQNILIDNVYVGGLTQAQAYEKILHNSIDYTLKTQPHLKLVISVEDHKQNSHLQQFEFNQISQGKYYEKALAEAFLIGRQGNPLQNIKTIVDLLQNEQRVVSKYKFNQLKLRQALNELKEEVDYSGEPHRLIIANSGNPQSIQFTQGVDGLELLAEISLNNIIQLLDKQINQNNSGDFPQSISAVAETQVIKHKLTDEEIELSKKRAWKFVSGEVSFFGYEQSDQKKINEKQTDEPQPGWIVQKKLNDQELVELLSWPTGVNRSSVDKIVEKWTEEIERPAINAEFEYNADNMRATKFYPGQTGLEVNQAEIKQTILEFIKSVDQSELDSNNSQEKNQKTAYILLKQTQPEIKLADTNNLGIKVLIGFGESHYYGSIAPRLHNIKVASEKLNGTIVSPGEKFSFNQTVGVVNRDTGFQPAYVIRAGRTLMEFGGGVCQVSTTTFRALLDAGVNITRRLPHSYRVSYYEYHNKPGYDATVYSGNVDLRFENDTPGHILITAEADSSQAYMTVKMYGTNDGRQTEIKNHKQWGYAAPPPAQEIPDESLAPGQRKKVENAIPGLRVSFDWVVTDEQGNAIHEKTFNSNYQAWGEKWLVGI